MTSGQPVITCGICFNLLTEPVTWACNHSYCLSCIKAQMEQGSGADSGFTCPMCNVHHPAERDHLRSRINEDLAARVAALSKGVDGALLCQWCEEVQASVHCPDCPYILCADCNVAVHKNSAKRHHQPVPCKDPRMAKSLTKKCLIKHHEEYKLDFYCTRCEELCCAYCLQMGPHHMHENVIMAKAAHEARQRMGRDLESLNHTKNRMENQAHEMNRVCALYQETYDNVEGLISDRFAAFHQQLAQKELEVRSHLQTLREEGDNSLAIARLKYLTKLNAINEAVLQFRRLQHGGADYEVLENRAQVSSQLRGEVPAVSGGVFRMSDLGDLHISGLGVTLDLAALNPPTGQGNGAAPSANNNSSVAMPSAPASTLRHSIPPYESAPPPPPPPARDVSRSVSDVSMSRPPPQAPRVVTLTFAPDRDVQMTQTREYTSMQCAPNSSVPQIGIRANETFDYLYQVVGELIVWRIRLDAVYDSKVGIVEKGNNDEPEGFYWRPTRQHQFDGNAGRPGPALRNLPVCQKGDILTFMLDVRARVLTLSVNGADCGVMLTDVPLRFAPCLIFRPGEAMSVLNM